MDQTRRGRKEQAISMYKPIGNYGLIGDMNSAALVGIDGCIDWCCFPRFDSPSVFAAVLDHQKGGRFQIAPEGPIDEVRQTYVPNTNILSTRFRTPTGELTLTDFMPLSGDESYSDCPHEIHRIVRCSGGTVTVRCIFQPRMDYARTETTLTAVNGSVKARGGHQNLTLCSQVPLEINGDEASAEFTLRQGEEVAFVAAYGHGRPGRIETYRTAEKLQQTKVYWEVMASGLNYEGMWKDEVIRSFLVLHLMVYRPTGAVIAAPTTSLPETIGGSRNWDYRFAWLRDSSFVMDILYRMGHMEEADRYLSWLTYQCKVTNGKARILYGISPASSVKEMELDHLEGYEGSGPVRIGNGAARHFQLDVFGGVIRGVDSLQRNGGVVTDEAWSLVENFAEVVCNKWRLKDRGVWEVRGPQQHFVYSKLMSWVALDRAARIAEALGRNSAVDRWRQTAAAIKEEVIRCGWNDRKKAFVQHYSTDSLDASNLVLPLIGFLRPDDPRILSTIEAIRRELADGPLVQRYIPDQTEDGLGGQNEGAFTILSFWLIGGLVRTGRVETATEYFEQMLSCANHLGLFAEMIDPTTKQLLGNFPQAYSHIGLIHSARNLSRVLSGGNSRSDGTRAVSV